MAAAWALRTVSACCREHPEGAICAVAASGARVKPGRRGRALSDAPRRVADPASPTERRLVTFGSHGGQRRIGTTPPRISVGPDPMPPGRRLTPTCPTTPARSISIMRTSGCEMWTLEPWNEMGHNCDLNDGLTQPPGAQAAVAARPMPDSTERGRQGPTGRCVLPEESNSHDATSGSRCLTSSNRRTMRSMYQSLPVWTRMIPATTGHTANTTRP